MKRTVYKWFWLWDFEKEEQWLNDMAAQGLVLTDLAFPRYEFEQCDPGEYHLRLEMLENRPSHPESTAYLSFLEETGVEHVTSLFNWVYLRKKTADGPFDLFSDIDSRIRHVNRIMMVPGILAISNTLICLSTASRLLAGQRPLSTTTVLISLAATGLLLYGLIRLYLLRRRLARLRLLHE